MKPKHYIVSFMLAVFLVFLTQFILVQPGNASCMTNGAMVCPSRDDYFNKYGWPFAYKSVAGITDMNNFAEYHPGMMFVNIALVFILIVSTSYLFIKFRPAKK